MLNQKTRQRILEHINGGLRIKIEKDDQALFESEILQPYFDMTLNKLFGDTDPDMKYWWLTANPKIWSFADLKVGEEQSYTLYNENGHKRRIFQNFLDAKVGDIVKQIL